MSRYASLMARNAASCEAAQGPRCRCRCGGTLHGKPHPDEWVADQVGQLESEAQERKQQDDLPGEGTTYHPPDAEILPAASTANDSPGFTLLWDLWKGL